MSNSREYVFEKAPIPKAIAALALPTMFSMLVNIIYNMADTFFIGQTHDEYQFAAVSLAYPVFLLFNALGSLFGAGGGAYISRLLGVGRKDEIKKVSSFCYYGSILSGLILLAIFMVFMRPILNFAGATENTYEYAREYLTIIAAGGFSIVIQTSFAQIVRSEGAAAQSMIGMLLGTIINIVLDPIMILAMNMGVSGAAWATIIGNMASLVYYSIYCSGKKSILSISSKDLKISKIILANVMSIGIPQAVMNVLMTISTVILNYLATKCQDAEAIQAGFGAANKVNTVVVMLMIGLGQGIQPLLGYNYAAKNFRRMKKTVYCASVFSVILGAALMTCFFVFPDTLIRIFMDNDTVVKYGVWLLKALAIIAPIFGLQYIVLNLFQAIGKEIPALIISISRQGVFFMAAVFIGYALFSESGLVWSQPVADTCCVTLSIILYIIYSRKLFITEENK